MFQSEDWTSMCFGDSCGCQSWKRYWTSYTESAASQLGAFVRMLSVDVISVWLVWFFLVSLGLFGAVRGAEVAKPLVMLQQQVAFHNTVTSNYKARAGHVFKRQCCYICSPYIPTAISKSDDLTKNTTGISGCHCRWLTKKYEADLKFRWF